MSDLISRQDAIDIVAFECGEWQGLSKEINEQIQRLPSAKPAQKKGKWLTPKEYCQHLYETTGERYSPAPTGLEIFVYCSQCGKTSWFSNKYCPHCGSRNRGEEE